MPSLTRLLVAAALVYGPPVRAAVVAVYNVSPRPVTFAVGHPGKPPVSYTLASGESRLVPTGRSPDITYTAGGKQVRYRLDPYHAYMFSPDKDQTGAEFHGIDLAGAMPRPTDVPVDPPSPAVLKLPVALFADDANPRSRDGWEKQYRGRLAAASAVLEKQCGVTLAVTTVGDWRSDPTQFDLFQQAKLFERLTVPPGTLAVGYTSRFPKAGSPGGELMSGYTRGPLWPYILIRDAHLRSEAERIEAVVREVGHYLGAAHSPDPLSAVRAKPADGRGYAGRYPIGLDPLNLLAVGIWVEELQAGSPKSIADLRPISRERLAVIYKTLSGLLPADSLAAEHLAELERVGEVVVAPAKEPLAIVPATPKVEAPPKPEPPKPADPPVATAPKMELPPLPKAEASPKSEAPKPELPKPAEPPAVVVPPPMPKVEATPKPADPPPAVIVPKAEPPAAGPPSAKPRGADRTEAVRKVVKAVRLRAIDLSREPDADKAKGDALTVELLMAAADIAYGLDGPLRAPAFNIGIGIALDHSEVLRSNVLVGSLVKAAETDAERAARLAALGNPTLRGRRDLCQHFVVSAALAELIGPAKAETIGVLKELADRDGVSGFSFADLAADLAGIQLAVSAKKYPELIGRFRDGVNLNDYMPAIAGLREGMTAAKFKELYGELDDERFKAELEAVRKRVTELPKYREIAELKVQ